MAVVGYQLVQIATDWVTADLLVWKMYRTKAPGILEIMLDANPQLAYVHRTTPFIPVGVFVRVPLDPDLLAAKPPLSPLKNLWTDVSASLP